MNSTSEKRFAIIAFRALGILIILTGLILTTLTIIGLMAVSSLTSNVPRGVNVNIKGPAASMGAWAIVARLFVIAWGAVVYTLADWLSGLILPDSTAAATTQTSGS